MTAFAKWLKATRIKRGVTQAQLAKSVGVTHSYISHLEHGHFCQEVPPDRRSAAQSMRWPMYLDCPRRGPRAAGRHPEPFPPHRLTPVLMDMISTPLHVQEDLKAHLKPSTETLWSYGRPFLWVATEEERHATPLTLLKRFRTPIHLTRIFQRFDSAKANLTANPVSVLIPTLSSPFYRIAVNSPVLCVSVVNKPKKDSPQDTETPRGTDLLVHETHKDRTKVLFRAASYGFVIVLPSSIRNSGRSKCLVVICWSSYDGQYRLGIL